MPKPLLRRTFWILTFLAVVVLATILALPMIASTHLVRDRIGQEIGFWTGYRVNVGARPEIKVWPSFSAVLHDVSFSDWDAPASPVLQAERIEIDMSALAALRGDVYYKRVRFIGPVMRVEPDPAFGYSPVLPRGGKIVRSIRGARLARNTNPAAPDVNALPDDPLGRIEFIDGSVVLGQGTAERVLATRLTGAVNWPALNRGGSLSLQGTWNGESVAVDMASAQPLLHMAGATSEGRFSFRSSRLNAAFEGRAGFEGEGFVEGSLQIAAPSLRGALDWLDQAPAVGVTTGALDATSQVAGTSDRLKFTNASLVVAGSTGIGSFDLALRKGQFALSGGLAFETIDLPTLLALFSPALPGSTDVQSDLFGDLNLDLRLSAAVATAGAVTLNEVAATAQVKNGLVALDLSDASAFGGVIQAGIRSARERDINTVNVRLLATDINGEAAGDALGLARLVPTSRGTVSLTLGGSGATWQQVLGSATGAFSADFGAGTLRHFNLADFRARLQGSTAFALTSLADGAVPIDAIQVKATATNGVAELLGTAFQFPDASLLINGTVPFTGDLQLNGSIEPRTAGSATTTPVQTSSAPPTRFVVGGPWSAPVVSPAAP